MALTQFTSDWNDSFQLKIAVSDIKKPTQSFLFEVLEFFLGVIHIDSEKLKLKLDDRHFKIKLVQYYNDFFKVCNPKLHPFVYGDLLRPDPKKVLEIMRFLLNYHLFVKAVHQDVVDTASHKIETYNALLSQKNQLQLHQEEVKIQSKKKEATLKETARLIAENKHSLEMLNARSKLLTEDTDSATKQLHLINEENIRLECEEKELEPSIVTEAEMERLAMSVKTLSDQYSKLSVEENWIQSKTTRFTQEMGLIAAEIEELSRNVNEISVTDTVEKCRNELKNLTELKNKIKEFRNQIEYTTTKREELVESNESLEARLLNKRKELSAVLEKCQTKIMEMESAHQHVLLKNANHEKKLEIADQKLEQVTLTQDQLIEMGAQVIEHILHSDIKFTRTI